MKKILKAGTYYIGDPCYIFNQSWEDILDKTDYLNDCSEPLFGKEFFCHDTAYGDGEYHDNTYKSYSVDAGMIACMPIEFIQIDNTQSDENILQCGNVVTFENDFLCWYDDGVFTFGDKIIIDTGSHTNEDDDYSEYDCDYE